MKLFIKLAVMEFFSTLLIVASTRAYTQAAYGWTLVTEFLWMSLWFAMQKVMIEETKSRSWLGYWAFQVGTMLGAVVGIYLTKRLYGQ